MQMKNIHLKQRLTTIGLFVVLLALTLCSIGATFIVWQTAEQASKAIYEDTLYQQANHQLLLENSTVCKYSFQPGSENRNALQVAHQQVRMVLQRESAIGQADDIAAIKPILAEQARFFTAAERFFALIDAHDITRAITFYNAAIDPLFATISGQLEREAAFNHDIATQSLAQMQTILRLAFIITTLVFVFGISLIFLFLWTSRRYQHQQYVNELAEQDMQRMANVQLHLLPRELPTMGSLEVYACSRPARQVGGDFYTFDKHASGQCALTIGDVSGKGLRAALLMAMMRTIIQVTVHALLQLEPKAIAGKVNEHLYDDFTEVGMFATIFVSCYDPATRQLAYTNAGHSPVIYCPAGDSARFLDADVPMIGVLPMLPTRNTTVPLAPDDVLVMATDGLSEAHNADGEMFGYERLLALVEQHRQESAQNIAEALFEAVNGFAGTCEQFDDQTVVIMKGIAQ